MYSLIFHLNHMKLNPDENHHDLEELHVDMDNLKEVTLGFGPEAAHISYSVKQERMRKFEKIDYASMIQWATNEEDNVFLFYRKFSIYFLWP